METCGAGIASRCGLRESGELRRRCSQREPAASHPDKFRCVAWRDFAFPVSRLPPGKLFTSLTNRARLWLLVFLYGKRKTRKRSRRTLTGSDLVRGLNLPFRRLPPAGIGDAA